MFDPQPAHDASAGFASPVDFGRDTSILRRRVATLTRTVEERETTIASLVQQLDRARSDPSRPMAIARRNAGAAHEVQAPIRRVVERMRVLRRGFDWLESAPEGFDPAELRRTRLAMSIAIDDALDELDRIEAVIRAVEHFSPPADAA
ncbi:MAG TPA: hypothetical protein VH082_01965 [Rudaea sp.]|jgi:hypothetical protein|nr:hypothetical protein [Rudaea sp.]